MGLPPSVTVRRDSIGQEPLEVLASSGLSLMLLEADLRGVANEDHAFRRRYAPCFAPSPRLSEDVEQLERRARIRVLEPIQGRLFEKGLEVLLSRCLQDSMTERDGRWNLSWLRNTPMASWPDPGEGETRLSFLGGAAQDCKAKTLAEGAVKFLLKDDGAPAVVLDTAWRVLADPHRCPHHATYEAVAVRHGYGVRQIVVPERGGYVHMLFLTRSAEVEDGRLLDSLPAGCFA